MKKFIGLAILALTTAGCSLYAVDSKDTTTNFYAPKKAIDEVLYIEKIDESAYDQIGEVAVNSERRHGLDDIIPKMRYEAAIMGGDVISDIKSDASGYWKSVMPQKLMGNAYIRARFSAKVYVKK